LVHRLYVRGFKSINQLDLPCRRVNVFIGAPNTGKSNILEAIGVLSSIGHRQGGGLGSFVRMQSMVDLFRNKLAKNPIQIGFDVVINNTNSDAGLGISYESGLYRFHLETGNPRQNADLDLDANGNFRSGIAPYWDLLAVFKFYRFGDHDQFTPTPHDYLEPPSGRNLLSVLTTNESLRDVVAQMAANVGLKLILKESENKIELQKEFQNNVAASFPLRFTSESLQRTIFAYAVIYSNTNSVITLEEPEAHAFPYHTKSLAETIGLDKRGNQYFIATHNPYLLTSIIEKTPKDDLVVAVTSLAGSDTRITTLDKDQLANLFEAGSDAFFNLESLTQK
jgi:AAA15 family ATPase/GTPase